MLQTCMQRIRETNWRPALAFLMLLALGDAVYAACVGRWIWMIQDVAFVTWCTIYILAVLSEEDEKQEACAEIQDIRRAEAGIQWKFEACRLERDGRGWLLWNFDRKLRMPLLDGGTFFIGIPSKVMPEPED